MARLKTVSEGVCAARGFRADAIRAGIKKRGLDIALIVSDAPAACAAVATTNLFCAAPIVVNREHLRGSNRVRAVFVNSGNANACTGDLGLRDARKSAELVAHQLGCKPSEVLVASTGVIGVPLPMDKVAAGVREVCAQVAGSSSSERAVEAIMTTDTRPKTSAVQLTINRKSVTLGGMAKGAGMISPNMATMLGFLTTDADVPKSVLQRMLRQVVKRTFNRVTIDSDTSTNDTVILMANGASGVKIPSLECAEGSALLQALEQVCSELAAQIALDGEGATKLVRVICQGARNEKDAERAARTVADSPLVKTAVFGNDANWGRIVAALGRSGARFDPSKVSVFLGPVQVVKAGCRAKYREQDATRAISEKEVVIKMVLAQGSAVCEIKTCDLSYDYIKINAAYRT